MERPVIFLDFDGVLNTERYYARLMAEGKPTDDAWGALFDPEAVGNLRKILADTDARIVVSSSWRYVHKLGSLRMMWEIRELPGEIDGILPCDVTNLSRGEEIECWLERNGRPDYAIIDDLNDFSAEQQPHLVEINPIVGITETDATKAIKTLSHQPKP